MVATVENNVVVIALPGLPLAVEAETFEDAVTELIVALREYAAAWQHRLRYAPNHHGNGDLVQVTNTSSDDELRAWLIAAVASGV